MMNGMCGIDCAALSGLKLVLWRYSQGVALGCIVRAFQAWLAGAIFQRQRPRNSVPDSAEPRKVEIGPAHVRLFPTA
jgi:hypothetical protein